MYNSMAIIYDIYRYCIRSSDCTDNAVYCMITKRDYGHIQGTHESTGFRPVIAGMDRFVRVLEEIEDIEYHMSAVIATIIRTAAGYR